ncbi:hypothetical protein, partial [Bacillus thuringiensis]|uniref:hypothetical protein n=1 Tax=Bacillus thuringiensis TaxID=1428 RepID=UPI003338574B
EICMNKYNKMCSGPYQDNARPNCCNYPKANNKKSHNSEGNNDPSNSTGPYIKSANYFMADSNGETVISGRDYYLLNYYNDADYANPTQVSWWNANTGKYLGTQSRGENPYNTKFRFESYPGSTGSPISLEQQIFIYLPEVGQHAIDSGPLGVGVATRTGSTLEKWYPTFGNSGIFRYSFLNYGSREWLASDGPGTWMYTYTSYESQRDFLIVPAN